ncbi:transcription factor E2F6-like isoform X2 [Cimex lectularius]|uniref:E2F/DP family winged-helix DNA-binding domain-containing protein n=1 Tax=Cimex lectularius TaxID=79782 RepID=A0A8I6RF91_CIMLE|nr:transcription factor E2F6-like isoform X2 [Cimex lectularius]
MMSKVQRVHKLEDNDEIIFHSTPDMNNAKFASPSCKDELDGETIVTSPFHLLDHRYGRTPQNQNQREPTNLSKTQAVKRRLNLESPSGDEESGFKTPKPKKKSNTVAKSIRGQMKTPTRYDTSLGLLTKKFVELLQKSPRGIVDLNYASVSLDVQKRRIYDITNVLEGVGILEKRSKNNIQWRGGTYTESQNDVQNEIEKLEKEEKQLDELIKRAEEDMKTLMKETRYAYVSYQDIRSIKAYANQTVMVIKAPANACIEVPLPTEKSRVEMLIKTDKGEIEVFLCPDIKASKEDKPITTSASPSTSKESPPSESQKQIQIKSEPTSQIQKALISAADDFQEPYQLQTEDQHSSEADPDSCFCDEPFVSLEPPISDNDYLYSLDQDEGLMDLFDLYF